MREESIIPSSLYTCLTAKDAATSISLYWQFIQRCQQRIIIIFLKGSNLKMLMESFKKRK